MKTTDFLFQAGEITLHIPYSTVHTLVVGTGAAGYNAADLLKTLGDPDTVIVTEGIRMGTSRNTGSDKQTYYKLTMAGGMPDSVRGMAETLFSCGSMHGDIALCEAAGSARAFFRLVSLGVPFPQNEMGEYVGYKTDHDPAMRATSCGPLTSKLMTEALEASVQKKQIPVIDGCRVIRIFAENGTVCGCAALCRDDVRADNPAGLHLFSCASLVYAVGGPSAIYRATVYPESQSCALGAAFAAGASGSSLTESQYGIASTKFRWNLSGTYQQVLPRYVSVDADGTEREFLDAYFETPSKLLTAIFLKGYEWPFDPRKIGPSGAHGSSAVDLAVFAETEAGRRVYLDYTKNPSCAEKNGALDVSLLEPVVYDYLSRSGALQSIPSERLQKMNPKALALYRSHRIDLTREKLEIAVCAQHCNGGLSVTSDWESPTLAHFYPVGECAGTFGICRPGGTALNSTQVGSYRAARAIAADRERTAPELLSGSLLIEVQSLLAETLTLLDPSHGSTTHELLIERQNDAAEMSACGAFLRREEPLRRLAKDRRARLASFVSDCRAKDAGALKTLAVNYDILLTQYLYAEAMLAYLADGGQSRGSAVYTGCTAGELLEKSTPPVIDTAHADKVGEIRYCRETGETESRFVPVRPIPDAELWFETVYNRNTGADA